MKKILIIVFALLTSASAVAQSQVDRFKAVFDSFPVHVPDALIPDAPVIGNGDIGVTVGAGPDSIRFYVGKNDFWRSLPSYPTGSLALPGGLDIRSDLMSGARYHAEQLPGSARVELSYTSDRGELKIGTWVAATDSKLVIELQSTIDAVVTLNLWAQQGGLSKTDSGPGWVTRSFADIDNLLWPCHVAMALNVTSDTVMLKKGSTRTIVLAACSSFDSDSWKEDAIKAAQMQDIAGLKAAHDKWWNDFWNLSHVSFADPMLEKYYYLSQYIFASSCRDGKFAPGLFGPFITTDSPAWAGDYHLNYNYQSPYWDSFSSNHLCLVDNYDDPVLELMDKGRYYSNELTGTRGVLYPVGIGPHGLVSSSWPLDTADMRKMYGNPDNGKDCGAMFWHQVTNAPFAAANMLMRFYSTYDKAYAEKIYPFVLSCGDFWEDYLTFRDGTYQVVPDTFYEESPWKDIGDSRNTVTSLGLVRMTMTGLLELSDFLDVDKNRRQRWQGILDSLYSYPVENGIPMTGVGQGTAPVSASSFRIVAHGLILPSGVLRHDHPYTNLLLSQMAVWKESSSGDWFSSLGNGVETAYPAAVRCGWPAVDILTELKRRIEMQSYPNGWILQYGGGIETLSAVPMTINEMMLQSYEGYIRIFPNWDRTKDASFTTLRSYGAFLVSSSVSSGNIPDVTIFSEKGRDCTIENPWSSCKVRLFEDGRAVSTLAGNMLNFRTRSGSTYRISPL